MRVFYDEIFIWFIIFSVCHFYFSTDDKNRKKFLSYKPLIVCLYYIFCTWITVFVAEKYYVFGLMGFLVIYGLNKIKIR